MTIFLISLAVFGVAIVFMAVGVIFSNRRIKGSCGGLAGLTDTKGNSICDACTNPSPECRGENLKKAGAVSEAIAEEEPVA